MAYMMVLIKTLLVNIFILLNYFSSKFKPVDSDKNVVVVILCLSVRVVSNVEVL